MCVSAIRFFDPLILFPTGRPPPPRGEATSDDAVENGGDRGGHRCHGDGGKMAGGERGTEAAVLHAYLDGDRAAQALTASCELRE